MDKLFNSHWFVKIISFFIALMLFAMVNMDDLTSQPGILPSLSDRTSTLEEVEVTVVYDEENYAIVDQTEHVQVKLSGSQSAVAFFQLMRPTFEVFVDVTERQEGVHTLSIQHRGFPGDLSVSIVPQFARVELQEKQTVSIPVDVELVNADAVKEGYSVGTPMVSPVNVTVTAAREVAAEVADAKAYVDVEDADKMLEEAVPVKLYDSSGNELHLDVEPGIVDVRVPITSPNKSVPIKISREGELTEGVSIESINVSPKEVLIYGPFDVLESINVLEGLTIDLDDITEDQTFTMEVPVPPGVQALEPEMVEVEVNIAEEESRQWSDVSIELIGAPEEIDIDFADDEEETLSIIAHGAEANLDQFSVDDIQVYADVSNLSEGEHSVPIQINGPQNIRFSVSKTNVEVIVSGQAESE
ncbi:CdaR family protein [Alkalihalophilus lindianensis]|uniref:CdaR family protein n=1 Tax=Alkalihalophilus lindianensis TaxID=1630542 RepID=A0ABU3XFA3_9BACI|nr:CdaR family protein [Alkalihalophilus lindianensis]MDV2686573.1 CdaR family protein [Alkalihalophilus lindianensis]